MRKQSNKVKDYEIKICPICGEKFIPAGQHIYKVGKTRKFVCSWTCQRKYEKEHAKSTRIATRAFL